MFVCIVEYWHCRLNRFSNRICLILVKPSKQQPILLLTAASQGKQAILKVSFPPDYLRTIIFYRSPAMRARLSAVHASMISLKKYKKILIFFNCLTSSIWFVFRTYLHKGETGLLFVCVENGRRQWGDFPFAALLFAIKAVDSWCPEAMLSTLIQLYREFAL